MLIREVERGGGAIVRAMQARQQASDKTREAGLHCSTIINDYVDAVYPRKPRPAIPDAQRFALYELGDVIEEVIAEELARRSNQWVKPTPRRFERVWCSPDGYSAASRTIDEMKSTRLSSRHVVRHKSGLVTGIEESEKLLRYLIQIKCYMHVWGAVRGRLHILFLNGDWKPPFPKPRTFVVRPESRHECRHTWEQMMDHAYDRGLFAT